MTKKLARAVDQHVVERIVLAYALYFRDTAWEYRVLRRELLPHMPEVVIAAMVARLDLRV